jgi:hypothetical protein
VSWVGSLLSSAASAASAAWPRATLVPPRWGSGKANQRAGADGEMTILFHAGGLWPGATHREPSPSSL